ncbi:MAG TPA: dynamin family protein [Dongiaceae bacterium]|nr:dynamin family protein [Dongiaceae bacterium]
MDSARLSSQMDAYLQWRQDIFRELSRYRAWLNEHHVQNPDLEQKLLQAMQTLKDDRITIAFVGEFSRGKTELINALFFAHYGTRILPSGAGRTTMCPTELFYDHRAQDSYIRLLPIETRMVGSSIASFRKIPEKWIFVPLNAKDPKMMKKAFAEVANSKAVTPNEAAAMGFQVELLEPAPDKPDKVLIPAWRHAMISFDHALLRQGLTIIDTPGLNALGCEPELTFSLLPEAQSILLLLSASTGVSATDLDIWNRHIRDLALRESTGVYAVLNKIDAVWDELENDAYNQRALGSIRAQCARQLSIAPDEILTVSAKEGLLAQVEGNMERLQKSQLPALEELLSNDMMRRKELLIQKSVIRDIHAMLHGSKKTLLRRRETTLEDLRVMKSDETNRKEQLDNLVNQAKAEQGFYHKKLILLKSSRKMIEREGGIMLEPVSQLRLDGYLKEAGKALTSSWTIVGMNNAIDTFFDRLKADMTALIQKQEQIQIMVADIYARYESEQGLAPLDYPRFSPKEYLIRLDDLRAKSGSFRRNLRKLLTEQKSTSKRFLATVVNEGSSIYRLYERSARDWLNNVLMPLFQNAQEQKHLLDDHVQKLRIMASADGNAEERIEQIESMLGDIEAQIGEVDDMIKGLRKPAPIHQQRKVIPLITAQFSPPAPLKK